MTGTDWKDLEQAWQSLPEGKLPEAALVELRRANRFRWWSQLYLAGEVICTLAGLAGAAWMISKGTPLTLIMGIATFLFTIAAAGASLWARAQPKLRDEDPVMLAMAKAVRRIEFGMRMARGTLWAVVAGQLYIAAFALTIRLYGLERDEGDGYVAIAFALIWLSIILAGALVYMQIRSRDLERMNAIRASLQEG
jgi:hypothetical protein